MPMFCSVTFLFYVIKSVIWILIFFIVAECRTSLFVAVKDVSPLLQESTGMQYFCLGTFDPSVFAARSLDLMIQESSANPPNNQSKGNMDGKALDFYSFQG